MEARARMICGQSLDVLRAFQTQSLGSLVETARCIIACYHNGGKVLVFGNGGSAADSQHIAAELVGRFKKERRALACISLTTNTSILTALANDYEYGCIFERQIRALGVPGDVALGITTSGTSVNVVRALTAARELGLTGIAFTGQKTDVLREVVDICLSVPAADTPRIQEAHCLAAHILCELVEDALTHDPH